MDDIATKNTEVFLKWQCRRSSIRRQRNTQYNPPSGQCVCCDVAVFAAAEQMLDLYDGELQQQAGCDGMPDVRKDRSMNARQHQPDRSTNNAIRVAPFAILNHTDSDYICKRVRNVT